ncbi:IS110 family transposase [Mesorhizobium opportunistum]|uniref:transposase n=1 Tax=Mesorhizobium opportunistum TaxID=593909 RepID=UPI003336A9AD
MLDRLNLVHAQIRTIEATACLGSPRLRLQQNARKPWCASSYGVIGFGVGMADMLVHEILSCGLRDHRALARYAGLTGSPDESGKRHRKKGMARGGSARVWRGMVRSADGRKATRKTVIVALACKLLICVVAPRHYGRGAAGRQLNCGVTTGELLAA